MQLPVKDVAAAVPLRDRARLVLPQHAPQLAVSPATRSDRTRKNGAIHQDGCAFHVTDPRALFAEFNAKGLNKELRVRHRRHAGGRCSTWSRLTASLLVGERQTG